MPALIDVHHVELGYHAMHVRSALRAVQEPVHPPRVPVVGRARHVLGGGIFMAKEVSRPIHNVILVVVEYQYLRVRVGFGEGGAEVVGNELALRLRVVGARLPGRGEFGLVLDRHGVEINAVIGICGKRDHQDGCVQGQRFQRRWCVRNNRFSSLSNIAVGNVRRWQMREYSTLYCIQQPTRRDMGRGGGSLTRLDELVEEQRPTPRVLGIRSHAIAHAHRPGASRHVRRVRRAVLVVFRRRLHPRRRTPRRGHDAHAAVLRRRRFAGERTRDRLGREEHQTDHADVDVVRHVVVEFEEIEIVLDVVEVVGFHAEVARVDVRPAEAVVEIKNISMVDKEKEV